MTVSIIITLCTLLLLAYLFDLTAVVTKIPSVILLLGLGFLVNTITKSVNVRIPDLNGILPILGTIGLIMIVLEGALELEINASKLTIIKKSSLVALVSLILVSICTAYFLHYFENLSFKVALLNTIPLAIISSAIAIPSAQNLLKDQKEFIIYESSISDILGVLFFNFVVTNEIVDIQSVGNFILEFIVMLVISFIATILLSGFLNRIKHHIKFVPMIILVILIYSISKAYHLPALIFILIFGLFIGNIEEFRHYKFMKKFHPLNFSKDVTKFKEITEELAFLVRSLFFILFGYLIELEDVLNPDSIVLALIITLFIFLSRFFLLKLFKISIEPLMSIAPRGLITILLFLSIPVVQQIKQIDKSLIIQVILMSAIVMMVGLMRYSKPQQTKINASS